MSDTLRRARRRSQRAVLPSEPLAMADEVVRMTKDSEQRWLRARHRVEWLLILCAAVAAGGLQSLLEHGLVSESGMLFLAEVAMFVWALWLWVDARRRHVLALENVVRARVVRDELRRMKAGRPIG